MLISRCCRAYVIVEGEVTHYYVCMQCGRPAELIEQKGERYVADRRSKNLEENVDKTRG